MSLKGRCYDNGYMALLLDWELAVELTVNETEASGRREKLIRGLFYNCSSYYDESY